MDDEQDFDDDIAAQMGFASFGSKPKHKKRKIQGISASPIQQSVIRTVTQTQKTEQIIAQPKVEPDLKAYRQGVRNDRGDMVYFMPSFIEDPWVDLRKT